MRLSLASNRRCHPIISAGCAAVLLVTGTTFASTANADEVDELIAAMSEVSQEASAQNEEVKQLEIDIEDGQAELERLQADADSAQQFADSARTAEEEYQGEVNDLAGAKYRGLMVDPVINAIAASNPQNAIDRAAYLGTLTRGAEAVVDKLAEATAEAAASHTDASRALAEASFQQSVLEQQMAELDAGQEELNERIADIEEQVNALPPADQARWEGKNSPIGDADLSSVSGSGAVSAALAKLGSPYGWGAVGPSQFDCSGLMYWAYQQQGQSIPRTSQAQLAGGTPVSRADLQPGDIVGYYPGVTHVGMYIGNGQLVHASDYGIPVQIVSVDSMPWAGAVRY